MFLSVLGIGQAGGNIADLFAENGFYTAAINYSSRDLESLTNVENKLLLLGSEGVGKHRSEAIRLMNSNWDLATNFVKEHFSHPSIDIILVPFSCGGGSGSGVSPLLLNMLTELMPNKTFVAMPILPDKTETYRSQMNCLETFEDLSKLDITILPIDNEQVRTTTSNNGRVRLYMHTNKKVVSLIKSIIDYTDQPSKYSVLDKKDLLSIFKTKGFATISEVDIPVSQHPFELSESSFAELIQKSWNTSPFAKVEFDKVISAGIIFNGEERLMNCLNTNKVFSPFKNEIPLNSYEGLYVGSKNKVISILSGLSICKTRLNQIEDIVEKDQEKISAMESLSNAYTSKVNKLAVSRNEQPKKQPTVKDISAMISKFRR